ncbi:MAG: hypothetical protein FJ404_01635 [Verrucomicrobia bacterium]|nr:hypothetical protein [Verrucomicrobiota bacterium]
MFPRARTAYFETESTSQGLLVVDLRRQLTHELDPLLALIWEMSDGVNSVPTLLERVKRQLDPAATEASVWSALDSLTEMGLMERRVASPVGHSRLARLRQEIDSGLQRPVMDATKAVFHAHAPD